MPTHLATSPHTPHTVHWRPVLLVLLTSLACGWVDYITGYELSVFALYALPVILATRFFGLTGGVASSILCTAIWIAADIGAGHPHALWWMVYWNGLHRCIFFVCVALAFHHARASLRAKTRSPNALLNTLPVCTQCQRIAAKDGHWHRLESYLCEHAGTPPLHKVCPDCARARYARAGSTEQASSR